MEICPQAIWSRGRDRGIDRLARDAPAGMDRYQQKTMVDLSIVEKAGKPFSRSRVGRQPYVTGRPLPGVKSKPLTQKTERISASETNRAKQCLARNIFFEARGETLAGQFAVAWVVRNRLASDRYPDRVRAELIERITMDG